jgi:hypothetical protein
MIHGRRVFYSREEPACLSLVRRTCPCLYNSLQTKLSLETDCELILPIVFQ